MSTSTSTEQRQSPDLTTPDGWHWGIGNRSQSYYTHWLYTDKVLYEDGEFGWECQIWWDEGNDHFVQFVPITRLKPNGDLEYGYPEHSKSFETELQAKKYALRKAAELR